MLPEKNKSMYITVRITEHDKTVLQKIAKKNCRTVSDQTRYIILKYINNNGDFENDNIK